MIVDVAFMMITGGKAASDCLRHDGKEVGANLKGRIYWKTS